MTADYELVEVNRLLGCETVKAQVVKDEQVRGEERAEGAVHGVVHSVLDHGPKKMFGWRRVSGGCMSP